MNLTSKLSKITEWEYASWDLAPPLKISAYNDGYNFASIALDVVRPARKITQVPIISISPCTLAGVTIITSSPVRFSYEVELSPYARDVAVKTDCY